MNHYLIYSQSDQETLRSPATDGAFDGVAVPGTIAGFFPDATASFILTSKKPYFIDIKTPLFQGDLRNPRASHLTLAEKLAPSIAAELQGEAQFPPSFYTHDVIGELVQHAIAFQVDYADQAAPLRKKLDKYARLRALARNEAVPADPSADVLAPEIVLAPYFCSRSREGDDWREVVLKIWQLVAASDAANRVSPVVALDSDDPADLANLLALVPPGLNRRILIWLTGFDERSEPVEHLLALWRVIEAYGRQYDLINLYGSYFSIMASHAGLTGLSNGIGYSETRRWPELGASGAAPARYYVPRLHAFLSPGEAQLLVDRDPWFACECTICERAEVAGRPSVIALTYHELKQHFVLARKRELGFVADTDLVGISREMEETLERVGALAAGEPAFTGRVPVGHLKTWRDVLEVVVAGPEA